MRKFVLRTVRCDCAIDAIMPWRRALIIPGGATMPRSDTVMSTDGPGRPRDCARGSVLVLLSWYQVSPTNKTGAGLVLE